MAAGKPPLLRGYKFNIFKLIGPDFPVGALIQQALQ
jgi:hypothetical protein